MPLVAPVQTTIFVVRHAEVHNPQNILYGRLPRYRLSTLGREQAERTARFLAGRPITALYTSPLLRARQTAGFLSRYHPGAPVRTSSLLLETRTGYQGSSQEIIKPGFSFYDPLKEPGDETIADIWKRMERMLQRVIGAHPGGNVVLVSHADPIAIMRLGLLGRPLTTPELHATVYPARASVQQILVQPDGEIRLTYFNPAAAEA